MKWLDKTNRQLSSIFGKKEHWWSNSYSPWDSSSKQRSLEECLWQPAACGMLTVNTTLPVESEQVDSNSEKGD